MGKTEGPNRQNQKRQSKPTLIPITKTNKKTPKTHLNAILEANLDLKERISSEVFKAHDLEPDESLRPAKALEKLLHCTMRTAALGPEWMLPAITNFHKIGEEHSELFNVNLPTVNDIIAEGEVKARLVSATRLGLQSLKVLARQETSYGAKQLKSDFSIETSNGLSLISMGSLGRLSRIPREDTPIENGLLCQALLILAEETIHAIQELQYKSIDSDSSSVATPELMCTSMKTVHFAQASQHKFDLASSALTSKEAEIDALAKMIDLAQEYNFPIECLSFEISQFHQEYRKEFVNWLIENGHLEKLDYQQEYYFKSYQEAAPIPKPLTKSTLPTECLKAAYELIEYVSSSSPTFMKALQEIANESLAALKEQFPDIALVKDYIEQAGAHCVTPSPVNELALEELNKYDSPEVALILAGYLRKIGFLVEADS